MNAIVAPAPPESAIEHEHVHRFMDGIHVLRHAHPMPADGQDREAIRPHRHVNGSHSHPHGHSGYQVRANVGTEDV